MMWFELWGLPSRERVVELISVSWAGLSWAGLPGWYGKALSVALETSDADIAKGLARESTLLGNFETDFSTKFIKYLSDDHVHSPCVYVSKSKHRIVCGTCGIYMTYMGPYALSTISKRQANELISLRMPSVDWKESQETHSCFLDRWNKTRNKTREDKFSWDWQEKNRLWKKWYNEVYLRSPEWKAKREQIKIRDSDKCVECGNYSNLQIHHKSYVAVSPDLPYGREDPNDLVTLCDLCHARKHPQTKCSVDLYCTVNTV